MSTSLWLRQLRNRLFGLHSRNSGRKARSTAAHRRVRPCLEALEDRLVLDAVQTVVTPSTITAPFSDSAQHVTLTANVTDTSNVGTTVNEGKVKFTVVNGTGKAVGSAASGTVASNGSASVSYGLPAFTNVGSYTVDVAYTDSADTKFSDGGNDTPGTLSVTQASTTTTAHNTTALFSSSAQNVMLSATVTSSAGAVDEGKVKFGLVNGTGKTIGSAASGTVTSNGSASVSYGLPAMTLVGSYTIKASYSDSKDNFADSDNSSQSPTPALTVNASTTTTASDATTAFSSSAQNVTLNATVTSSAGTVDEGTVTFTILQGTTVIGTATSENVSSGSASVNYALPAGTDAGTYTIEADYLDGSDNFTPSSDKTHTLSVTSATAAATTTKASDATATIGAANVTLTAAVTSSGGTVNEGSVTFTLLDSNGNTVGTATPGTVSNGSASVSYALPAGTAAGTYTIEANYSDSSGTFAISSDTTHSLTLSAPATTTTASNATVTFSSSAQNVPLSATVTSSAGTVDEGTVTFTILQGTTVIGTATSENVSSGSASVNYSLPAGTDAGTYTIDASYSDSSGTFAASSDTAHTLSVTSATAASTTTTASNATATFGAANVTLNATVTSSAGTVNEGTVTFTILQGTTIIGTATSDNVSSGSASVNYALPADTDAGTYTIEANYSDSSGNFAISSDTTHSLTVSAASTTTTASSATATFSSSAQHVTLNATVTSSAGTVDEGKVKFALVNGSGKTIGSALSGSVGSSGSASVSYGLPAFTNVGSYTIEASYSDSENNFADSTNASQSPMPALSVNAASTTTTATSTTASFSSSDQSVTLTATVASSAGTVNEGSVTFTLLDSAGNTIGTATSGNVSNGSTSVSYTLPGGTAVGSYTIEASYSDLFGNFASSSDSSHTVTVGAATSTSVGLTTVSITPNLSNSTAQVTLTAQVSSPGSTVNEGVVSFTLDGVTGQSSVSNGTATVQLTVPIQDLLTVSNVALSYSDTGGHGNFASGSGSTNLTTNFFNTMLSSSLTYNSDGSVHIDVQLGGQTLLSFDYTASGLPTAIDVASTTLPVTYTTLSGGDVLVSIDGVPWQLNVFNSSGQYQGLATLNLNPDGSTSWLILNSSGQAIGVLPGS